MLLARNILLVDDEAPWLRTLSVTLQRLVPEAVIDTCVDSRQVMSRLNNTDYALVLLDLTMPFDSGETLLESIRQAHPNTRVIIVTGVNEVDTAVRCIKHGAYDYFIKTDDVADLGHSVRRALEVVGLERNYTRIKDRFLTKTLNQPDAFSHILTCEPALLDQFRYLEAIAFSPEPILIQGESGTGKKAFAKSCHLLSAPEQPFITINLAGMSAQQFDRQLYGQLSQLPGESVAGAIHHAQHGVIYLKDIAQLPLDSQAKLAEVMEQKIYHPIGSQQGYGVNCRFVVSTQVDLIALNQQGDIRSDLLYRLRGHKLTLPPLRQRKLDLTILINHFVQQAAQELQLNPPPVPSSLVVQLQHYGFPGNLYELQSMVIDAVSRSDAVQLNCAPFMQAINDSKVASEVTQTFVFPAQLPTLADMNQALIDEAMNRTGQNQTAAAQMLGISQSALSRRLTKDK
ncbi:sigma-54-dependent transcriptional regulator [Shewanella intestini]|uniref:Sigma-54-dependent Fis family transcriptional regulator n=1 Tax=Shewanella intestini TaxID=2017544 RepID=A0ABS5I6D0_9GAMM|nr:MULTISPECIES: sigma 54-interacting transcriptional regulator [Shewanella]MBR9729582.1 sigma-54-dependent Fis family transcriptional regulator [Shewanella intestini]MRG37652.1 response regulator [Shewanella sp. XMDDZSB0408]